MRTRLLTLIFGIAVVVAAFLPTPVSAQRGGVMPQGNVALRAGYEAHLWRNTGNAIVPSMNAPCGGATRCSHPNALWRSHNVIALTGAQQWLEIECSEPTSTLAIQFQGDDNDGWTRIQVDGDLLWEGNTYGHGRGGAPFLYYLEITDLPRHAHTIRVEAIGRPGWLGGSSDVAVAAFICGIPGKELHLSPANFALYLPTIDSVMQL